MVLRLSFYVTTRQLECMKFKNMCKIDCKISRTVPLLWATPILIFSIGFLPNSHQGLCPWTSWGLDPKPNNPPPFHSPESATVWQWQIMCGSSVDEPVCMCVLQAVCVHTHNDWTAYSSVFSTTVDEVNQCKWL